MLIQADASQLEWRTVAQLSQDPTAIEEIIEGLDTHSLNQLAFGLPSRLIAKVYLFRTIFRGSGWSFANDPDFMHVSANPKYWDEVNEKFFAKYHGIDRVHKKWADDVIRQARIDGPLGRSWSIGMRKKQRRLPNGEFIEELVIPWTLLSNYPVQGTGADVMMFARLSSHKRIKKAGIPCKFISTVHDSIVLDTHERYVQDIAEIFNGVFADIPKNIKNVFGYNWNVPMACESKYGHNMKEMAKIS